MRQLLAFVFSLLLVIPGRAQDRVRNVRIQVIDSSQIQVLYDLIEIHPGDSVYVEVESRTRGALQILPEFVRGDLGKQVTLGANRRIIWEALANGYSLNEDVRARVLVKAGRLIRADQPRAPSTQSTEANRATESTDPGHSHKSRYAGPAWALLSAVAPGIGNIFVQQPKPKIGLRPLVTVGCYGLLAYGLSERQKATDVYAIYEQQKNMTDAEPYYKQANSHHQNYYLATRGALIIAAVDVVLTFMKGIRNNRLSKQSQPFQSVTFRPGLQAGQPTAVIHYSF